MYAYPHARGCYGQPRHCMERKRSGRGNRRCGYRAKQPPELVVRFLLCALASAPRWPDGCAAIAGRAPVSPRHKPGSRFGEHYHSFPAPPALILPQCQGGAACVNRKLRVKFSAHASPPGQCPPVPPPLRARLLEKILGVMQKLSVSIQGQQTLHYLRCHRHALPAQCR